MKMLIKAVLVTVALILILHTGMVSAADKQSDVSVLVTGADPLPRAVTPIIPTTNEPEELQPVIAAEPPEQIEEPAVQIYYTVVAIDEKGNPTARLSTELQNWVYEMCSEYGIPGYEQLIIAKLYCESSFRTSSKHTNGNGTVDYGIAQINSCNLKRLRQELGISDFMDPYQSIQCGVYIMAGSLYTNGFDEEKALVAYNMGQDKVDSGTYSTKYSKKVIRIRDNMIPDGGI